jgi:hypothetical protein
MRKSLVNEIIRSKSKISEIIEESTTLSNKSTMKIYVRLYLANYGMDYPGNLFLDLIELQSDKENGLFQALLDCLQLYDMKKLFCSYLVSVTCDGAALMLGRKSGVAKLLKGEFPSVIV